MTTMTISEAEQIYDIVHAAFQATSHRHHPVSALEGYDIYQICIAFRLRIAGEFLLFSGREDFEKNFADGLEHSGCIPGMLPLCFVPDDQVDSVCAEMAFCDVQTGRFKDKRLDSVETADSFGAFCKSVGSKDPLYWQKIYTRLGLEYTSISPKGNDQVYSKLLGPTVGPDFEARLREIRDRLPPGPS